MEQRSKLRQQGPGEPADLTCSSRGEADASDARYHLVTCRHPPGERDAGGAGAGAAASSPAAPPRPHRGKGHERRAGQACRHPQLQPQEGVVIPQLEGPLLLCCSAALLWRRGIVGQRRDVAAVGAPCWRRCCLPLASQVRMQLQQERARAGVIEQAKSLSL